jgi:RHS repeat-associated protein
VLIRRLHSTRVVTDNNSAVTGRYDYEPYGAQNPGNLTDGTSQLWQGQRSDDDSGLTYMNARFYDPELGQFTAPDSLVPDLYQPQTLNRYAIDNDDPINRVDPSGHMSMRVELKKEQEYQGLRFGTMYLRALLGGCVAAGGFENGHSGITCPSIVVPDLTVYGHRPCDPNCSKPVDKKSEETTKAESVEVTTKVASETVSNEAELLESSTKSRPKDSLECDICNSAFSAAQSLYQYLDFNTQLIFNPAGLVINYVLDRLKYEG